MTRYDTAQLTEFYRDRGEDRVAVIDEEQRTLIVVADGAGGVGGGDVAAETVIREVKANCSRIESADQWSAELQRIDYRVGPGESTAVVVDLRPGENCGSSVGDSQAWVIDLGQQRKPLLGSQHAQPVGFTHGPLTGLLLVATDGFWNYVKQQELTAMLTRTDFYAVPRSCVELVRLPSGELWDDIGIVACRVRPASRTRKRYVIE